MRSVIGFLVVLTLVVSLAGAVSAQEQRFERPITVAVGGHTVTIHSWAELWSLATGNNRLLHKFSAEDTGLGRYDFSERQFTRTDAEAFARIHLSLRADLNELIGRDVYSNDELANTLEIFKADHSDDLERFADVKETAEASPAVPEAVPSHDNGWGGWIFAFLALGLVFALSSNNELRRELAEERRKRQANESKKVASLQTELRTLGEQKAELQANLHQTNLALVRAQNSKEALDSEVDRLTGLLDETTKEYFKAKERAEMLSGTWQRQEARFDEACREKERLEKDVSFLERACDRRDDDYRALEEHLKVVFRAFQAQTCELITERRAAEERERELRIKLARQRAQREREERNRDLSQASIHRLVAALRMELQAQYEQLTATRESFDTHLAAVTQELAALGRENRALRIELGPLADMARPLSQEQREAAGIFLKVLSTGKVSSPKEQQALVSLQRKVTFGLKLYPTGTKRAVRTASRRRTTLSNAIAGVTPGRTAA